MGKYPAHVSRSSPGTRVTVQCMICGVEMHLAPAAAKTRKTCSLDCAAKYTSKIRRKQVLRECPTCGTEFKAPNNSNRVYCCRECRRAAFRVQEAPLREKWSLGQCPFETGAVAPVLYGGMM